MPRKAARKKTGSSPGKRSQQSRSPSRGRRTASKSPARRAKGKGHATTSRSSGRKTKAAANQPYIEEDHYYEDGTPDYPEEGPSGGMRMRNSRDPSEISGAGSRGGKGSRRASPRLTSSRYSNSSNNSSRSSGSSRGSYADRPSDMMRQMIADEEQSRSARRSGRRTPRSSSSTRKRPKPKESPTPSTPAQRRSEVEQLKRTANLLHYLKLVVYIILVDLYIFQPEGVTELHEDAVVVMRSLPLFWLWLGSMIMLQREGHYRMAITMAYACAGAGEVGLQVQGEYYVSGILLHGVAYMFLVWAIGVEPFGPIIIPIPVFIIMVGLGIHVTLNVDESVIKLVLSFLCISVFLMLWRAIVQVVDLPRKLSAEVILCGCIMLAVSEVFFMYGAFREPIVNPAIAVPLCFYGGFLAIEHAPYL